MNVRLTQEQKIKILNSDEVYSIMQQVLLRENKIRRNQEHFWIIGLNKQNKVLFIELISLGATNRLQVNAPELFRMAIYKLAVNVILIHNHPGGSTEPSDADMDCTDRMTKAATLLNINVTDHLIITEENYMSFADYGIMESLKTSGKYELLDEDKIAMRKWKEQLERETAIEKKQHDIARKMKDKGFESDIIKELTGLSKWDIKKL
jgi:DNA repair protein RadC